VTYRGITATDAARLYNSTPNRIHRLAHHHNWNRTRLNGRTYYDLTQVDAVLQRPQATARMRKLRALFDNV
jgi:hypothetical protein